MNDAQPKNMPIVEVAKTYAHFGWSVFPCRPDKTPYTPRGFQDATTDALAIEGWWTQQPDAAIGIACGASQLVVIDHDPKNDPAGLGKAKLEDLLEGVETRTARTGSGGMHYYFHAPNGIAIRNSAGHIAPGVDVRGDGGYVIAPPSRNEKGEYSWINGAKCVTLPPQVTQALQSRPAPTTTSGTISGHIPEGRRNETLASLAGTLWRRGMAPLAVEDALLRENEEHCLPPLSAQSVRAIAKSITRYPTVAPGTALGPIPGAPSEASVEVLDHDALRVATSLKDGSRAAFLFTDLEKSTRELNAHLTITHFGDPEPYQQRINLESHSAREGLRRELDNIYDKNLGWAKAINSVWTLARATFLAQDRSIDLSQIPVVPATELIAPFMPGDGATIFFGDGESAKSYVALMLAVCGVTGQMAAGFYSVPTANVLYIDYETGMSTVARRRNRILAGLGVPSSECSGLRYWSSPAGLPLFDQAKAIRDICDKNSVGWVIVDSAAPATGGDHKDSDSATAFYNGLRVIGRPALVIAHITKSTDEAAKDKPFGSTFYHNLARRTWYVKKVQAEGADELSVSLTCKKSNDDARPRPQALHLAFDGQTGPVVFTPTTLEHNTALLVDQPAWRQIKTTLKRPMSTGDLSESLDISEPVVRKAIRDHPQLFVECGAAPGSNGRPQKLWALRAREDEENAAPF